MTRRASPLALLLLAWIGIGWAVAFPSPLPVTLTAPAAVAPALVAPVTFAPPATVAPTPGAPAALAVPVAPAAALGDDVSSAMGGSQGLVLELSDGERPPTPPAASAQVAEVLTADAVAALLARLPELPQEPGPGATRLPPRGAPPPLTGATLVEAFPADAAATRPPEQGVEPLRVLRITPEGEQPIVSHVTISFSSPMVPLAALETLDAGPVPALLEPQPPGRWRWLDPRLLVFEAEGRFPAATRCSVRVPAGTLARDGGRLAEEVAVSFATPPPIVVASAPEPDAGTGLEPLLLMAFDQRVSAEALLPSLQLESEGLIFDTSHSLRLARPDELDGPALARVGRDSSERVLGVVPTVSLPPDARLRLTLLAGAPSAEGPRRTTVSQSIAFRTRGAFALRAHGGTRDEPLAPGAPVVLRFTNALAPEQDWQRLVSVKPTCGELSFGPWNDRLTVVGRFPPRSVVTLSLSPELLDAFGQRLAGERDVLVHVGPYPPQVQVAGASAVVLDPFAAPALGIDSLNVHELDLRFWRVEPGDWPRFAEWAAASRRGPGAGGFGGGERVKVIRVTPASPPDTWARSVVGLADAFPGDRGHLVASVDTDLPGVPARVQWLQRTELGLDAQADGRRLRVWVTSLRDGSPVEGAEVSLTSNQAAAVTGADGLAELTLPEGKPGSALVLARRGDDVALLPEGQWSWRWRGRTEWVAGPTNARLLWYVLDDRGTYRPGERVSVKGWVRMRHEQDPDDFGHVPAGTPREVAYRFVGPRQHEWATGSLDLDAFGGFELELALPPDADPGQAWLQLDGVSLPGGPARNPHHNHAVTVAEFRRPEYEVTVAAQQPESVVGGELDLLASARYYTGGGLPDAELAWQLTARPTSWSPPGWEGFRFGDAPDPYGWNQPQEQTWSHAARTDGAGEHRLHLALAAVDPPEPTLLMAEAAVTDVNAQRWAGSLARLVHPSNEYPGLALDRGFVRPGETLGLRALLVDLDGTPVPGRTLSLRAARQVWVRDGSRWRTEERDAIETTLVSEGAPVATRLALDEPGSWSLLLRSVDGQGRPNQARAGVWVAGPEGRPPTAGVELEPLQLVADAEGYEPGGRAEVLVLAPFAQGEGLATLSNGPFLWSERFQLDDGSAVLSLPIDERLVPRASLRVDVVGAAPRSDSDGTPRPDLPPRPAQAWGALELPVSREGRRLHVALTPPSQSAVPGASASVDIVVTGADGEPVPGANVALIVADEAVLALGPWSAPDPLEALLPWRWFDRAFQQLRPLVVLGDPMLELPGGFPVLSAPRSVPDDDEDVIEESLPRDDEMSGSMRALGYLGYVGVGGDDASYESAPVARAAPMRAAKSAPGGAAPAGPVALRERFDALAAFLPQLVTDADGRVHADFELPDSLTRYRLTAVAVEGGARAGLGEAALTTRLPLMVRPSPPRMLNLGDALELPIVVQNGGSEPRVVELALAAAGLDLGPNPGRRVTVPAGDRVELRLPATPTRTGDARLAVVVVDAHSPEVADAARLDLPVLTPATREAFAAYGSLADGVVRLGVLAPDGALPGFGGLELTTSSTALAALTDAVLAVSTYPYGCAEQRASRVLSVTALDDVLAAFAADGLPDPAELRAGLAADLEQLVAIQNDDGGFPYWNRGRPSVPFLSVHVVAALLAARADDRPVDAAAVDRGLAWLADAESHVARWTPRIEPRAAASIVAYALAVQARAGVDVTGRARDLLGSRPLAQLDGEALAWLWPLLARDRSAAQDAAWVRSELLSRVTETAAGAQLVSAYERDGHVLLAGRRRATSLLLSALLELEPDSDLVPKLVAHLLGHREAGHWGTTQENVFALQALGRAFEVLEAETPDFTARAWIGDRGLADQRFVGRSVDRHLLQLPLDALAALAGDGGTELVLQQQGPGRLTWRAGLRYALPAQELAAESRGFSVSRTYEALGDADDLRRDDDGTWHVRRGAMLRVRLSMLAPAERHHVALVDRLPAGFEPLDAGLAVTGAVPGDDSTHEQPHEWFWRCFWWGGPWYDHAALRDAGAEVFAASVPADLHSYGYVVRATTPGSFVAPPAHAEEMYAPESFGRSASDRVVVE